MYSVLLAAALSGAGTAPADTYGSFGSYGGSYGDRGGHYQQHLVLPTFPYVDPGNYGPYIERRPLEPAPYTTVPYTPPSAPHVKNPWLKSEQPKASILTPKAPASVSKPPSASKPPVSVTKPAAAPVARPPQGGAGKLNVRYLDKSGQTEEPPLLIKGVPPEAPRSPAKLNTDKPAATATPEVRKDVPVKEKEKAQAPKPVEKPKAQPTQAPVAPPVRVRPTEPRKDPFALENRLALPGFASAEAPVPEEKAAAKASGGLEHGTAKAAAPGNVDERKGTLTSLKEEKADPNAIPGNRARLVVTLPPNARLFVNGQAVQAAVNPSSYLTPELRNDTKYFYTVHVEVAQQGAFLVSEARQVFFQPGGEARVSFENVAVFQPSSTPGSL